MSLSEVQSTAVGVYLIDKPTGVSSFAVVRRLRRFLQIKKVGHAGTLDPFATGLLLVCAGRTATRHIDAFMTGVKAYEARLQLGLTTTTQDPEGEISSVRPVTGVDADRIRRVLDSFRGEIMQKPPAFSALKHKGKPLYSYARAGQCIEKPARPVHIYALESLHHDQDRQTLDIAVQCSRGTYIRTLAADLGESLGCGAHLIALRRTASGPFRVTEALDGALLFADPTEAVQSALQTARIPVEEALARTRTGRETGGFALACSP